MTMNSLHAYLPKGKKNVRQAQTTLLQALEEHVPSAEFHTDPDMGMTLTTTLKKKANRQILRVMRAPRRRRKEEKYGAELGDSFAEALGSWEVMRDQATVPSGSKSQPEPTDLSTVLTAGEALPPFLLQQWVDAETNERQLVLYVAHHHRAAVQSVLNAVYGTTEADWCNDKNQLEVMEEYKAVEREELEDVSDTDADNEWEAEVQAELPEREAENIINARGDVQEERRQSGGTLHELRFK